MGGAKVQNALNGLVQQLTHAGLGSYEARRQALARIYGALQAQSAALAYIDTFWVLGLAAVTMFFLSFVLRKNDPRGGRGTISAH
jgi:hypothetical protein